MTFDRRLQQGKVLDLFAGAGGWDVGADALGVAALGIECDEWACRSGVAAGHARLRRDVASLDPHDFAPVWGLIASPPCQAYSVAGKQLGREDKPLVIACAHELAAENDTRAERLSECRDPRSLLTVEPLRFAVALRPSWIALEQVPGVLELWTLFAALLSTLGYESAAGILSAERYGVPQTRKRAFLIASLDGPVALPSPTHRSYNPRRPELPGDERDLPPWVSMADALGWSTSERVGFARRSERPGSSELRERDRRPASAPAFALTEKSRSPTREQSPIVQVRRGGRRIEEGFDPVAAPAQAVTSRVSRWQAHGIEAASERDAADETPLHYDSRQTGTRPRPIDAPAPTMLASGLAKGAPVWVGARPATTVACDDRIHSPGHKQNASDRTGRYERRSVNALRVTVAQAAVLQGFPSDYPWQGPRTRQFEQIGNAVPPPLAQHVLRAAMRLGEPQERRA